MRKRILVLFSILSLLLFISCESKSNLTLGSGFIQSDARIVYVDTVAVNMSTFILDSLATSGKKVALVGEYNNSYFGNITTKSYVILDNSNLYIDDGAIFDSLVLKLIPSGYYYGDTTATFKIKVNRVLEEIYLKNGATFFYNNSHFAYDSINTLGELEFKPKPKSKQEIRIRLSNTLGDDLLNKFNMGISAFVAEGGFRNYVKGIVINTDINNKAILGFSTVDTSILLNFYYHLIGAAVGSNVPISVSFSPLPTTSTDFRLLFNQIVSDKSHITLPNSTKTLKNVYSNPVSSVQLDNYSFVQGGTGVVTRVEFPYIKTLLEQSKTFQVIRAVLVVQPSIDMDINYLPKQLNLWATDSNNDFLSLIGNGKGTALNGSLSIDYIQPENTNYSWDISGFVKKILNNSNAENYNGLLLLPANYDSGFDQVLISDQKKSHYKTYLKLYLIYYE